MFWREKLLLWKNNRGVTQNCLHILNFYKESFALTFSEECYKASYVIVGLLCMSGTSLSALLAVSY